MSTSVCTEAVFGIPVELDYLACPETELYGIHDYVDANFPDLYLAYTGDYMDTSILYVLSSRVSCCWGEFLPIDDIKLNRPEPKVLNAALRYLGLRPLGKPDYYLYCYIL